MQRTTVQLPDDLLDEAKDLARRTSRTLTQLLEDAVRAELARTPVPSRCERDRRTLGAIPRTHDPRSHAAIRERPRADPRSGG